MPSLDQLARAVLDCPLCGAPMLRLSVLGRRSDPQFVRHRLEVDRCPDCAAEWFDFDELEQILGAPRNALRVLCEAVLDPAICARCGQPGVDGERLCAHCLSPRRFSCPLDDTPLRPQFVLDVWSHHCATCEGLLILPPASSQQLFDSYRRLRGAPVGEAVLVNEVVTWDPLARPTLEPAPAVPGLRCDRCGLEGLPRTLRPDDQGRILCGRCALQAAAVATTASAAPGRRPRARWWRGR